MKKYINAFQNTHCGTAFLDLKVNRLTIKFINKVKVKVKITTKSVVLTFQIIDQ